MTSSIEVPMALPVVNPNMRSNAGFAMRIVLSMSMTTTPSCSSSNIRACVSRRCIAAWRSVISVMLMTAPVMPPGERTARIRESKQRPP